MTVRGGTTTGGPVSRRWPVSVGAVTTTSSDGFSSPPERGPDVGEGAVLGRRQADRQRHGQAEVGQRRREQLGRDRVVPQEAGEQRREQPVLVLRALGPGRHQVRQLEVPRRQVPADDPAVAVVLVHPRRARGGACPRGCRRDRRRRWGRCAARPTPWWARRRRPRRRGPRTPRPGSAPAAPGRSPGSPAALPPSLLIRRGSADSPLIRRGAAAPHGVRGGRVVAGSVMVRGGWSWPDRLQPGEHRTGRGGRSRGGGATGGAASVARSGSVGTVLGAQARAQ